MPEVRDLSLGPKCLHCLVGESVDSPVKAVTSTLRTVDIVLVSEWCAYVNLFDFAFGLWVILVESIQENTLPEPVRRVRVRIRR